MITEYSNMTWPDDPYRTGQQLHRRPAPRLAAFTVGPRSYSQPEAVSAAVVYLPLHRTRAMRVSEATLTFGFRAVSAAAACLDAAGPEAGAARPGAAAAGADAGDATVGVEAGGAGAWAGARSPAVTADLDLMQARRHAAVLTGHFLPGDLALLRGLAGGAVLRGVTAVQLDWPERRQQARDRAAMFDCLLDLPGDPSLAEACQQASVALGPDLSVGLDQPDESELSGLVARTVQRALAIALVCARHLGRYEWEGTLHTAAVMAASVWDCLPSPGLPVTGAGLQQPSGDDARSPEQAGRVTARS